RSDTRLVGRLLLVLRVGLLRRGSLDRRSRGLGTRHFVVRFRSIGLGSTLRLFRRFHAGRRFHRFGSAIGRNSEASSLHLVGLFSVAVVPNGSDLRLLGSRRWLILRDLSLAVTLLFDVSLDHLGSGASSVISVLAFFKQHSNHNFGVAARSDADEPAIVFEVLALHAQ